MILNKLIKKFLDKIKKEYHLKILKRKYFRYGACRMCGFCCENIYVRHNMDIIKDIEQFEKIKKSDDYSFYKHITPIDKDEFGLVFSCDKFDKEKRLCTDHKNRPSICKNYPSEEIFKMGAQLKEECGFSFEPIEKFDEVFKKVLKRPPKVFEEFKD